ncbi:DNA-methyltransferase [Leifsonia sp. 22587]|uniref:DNA-methyltransferase n=1 Tax=Leifsonia sp. 22587 TaxID=3453946 RepID=UPI003F85E57A
MGRFQPGQIRDGIAECLSRNPGEGASIGEIERYLEEAFGEVVPSSSIRSYLQLNTPGKFERLGRGRYRLADALSEESAEPDQVKLKGKPVFKHGKTRLFQADSLEWLASQPENSIHGVVTDPPYGLVEYTPMELAKLRAGRGGTWRIPPSFDGHTRAPLPRFTTLSSSELDDLERFFRRFGETLKPVLVPGAHVMVAANPLVSHLVSYALDAAGFERRGEIVRLVTTMRGGDRPKNAHEEFSDVSVMPRSNWEPWLLFRKPTEGTVAQNLRKWGTGGLRRISAERPFGDVIQSAPTHAKERKLANHPSLKPQAFLRQVVRAILPLGEGTVLDPFAGSGSTLAAAEAVGYQSVGVELDPTYADLAARSIPLLAALPDRVRLVEVDPVTPEAVDSISVEG